MDTDKKGVAKKKYFTIRTLLLFVFLFFVLLFFLRSYSIGNGESFLVRAEDRAVGDFVDRIIGENRCQAISGIAVFTIENDNKGSIRSAMKTHIIGKTKWKLLIVDQHEVDKIIAYAGHTLKYKQHYDSQSLYPIGQLLGTRYAIIGSLLKTHASPKAAHVILKGQVLDLQQGEIIFAGTSHGKVRRNPNKVDWAVNILIATGIFLLLFFLSRGNYFYGEPAKKLILWLIGIILWATGIFIYYV